jgi:hypothetical protein
MDDTAAAADRFKQALDAVFGPAQSLADAEQTLYDNSASLSASFDKNGTSLDVATEAGRNNRTEIEKSVKGYEDYTVALVGSGASQEEATNKLNFYRNALIEQAVQSGLSREEVEKYINQLGLTPENVTTAIQTAELEKAKADVKNWLDNVNPVSKGGTVPDEVVSAVKAALDHGSIADALAAIHGVETNNGRGWVAVVRIVTQGTAGQLAGGLSGRIDRPNQNQDEPPRAGGGPVVAGMRYLTAEGGRYETLTPSHDAWVISHDSTKAAEDRMSASSGRAIDASLHVHGNVFGMDEMDRWADDRDRKLASLLRAAR